MGVSSSWLEEEPVDSLREVAERDKMFSVADLSSFPRVGNVWALYSIKDGGRRETGWKPAISKMGENRSLQLTRRVINVDNKHYHKVTIKNGYYVNELSLLIHYATNNNEHHK